MKTCLLPLTIPESLLCRTLAQILGQWQLDTYTLPNNIHTASRTCLSGLRRKKEKIIRKITHPPPNNKSGETIQKRLRKGNYPLSMEKQQPRSPCPVKTESKYSSHSWRRSLKPGSITCWLLEGTFALCFGREIQLQHTAAASLKERRQHLVSFLCFCPHFQASWLAWTGDLSRHVDIPEWNGTICGLWDFVLKHHCWCVCSDCCSVYGRKWIQALG